jgi:hypothetical protein
VPKEKTKNTNGAFVFGEKKKPVLPPKLEPALNIHSGLLPKLMIGLGNTFTTSTLLKQDLDCQSN